MFYDFEASVQTGSHTDLRICSLNKILQICELDNAQNSQNAYTKQSFSNFGLLIHNVPIKALILKSCF